MKLSFYKYQGAGNDFVMIDDRNKNFPIQTQWIERLCDRHFGIGADGLILLQKDDKTDFRMVYFNADGNESSMCGNGGRCIVRFAQDLNLIENETTFIATDGLHQAVIKQERIELKMSDVASIQQFDDHLFLNTGSPHHIEFVDNLAEINVKEKGAKIRYGAPYFEAGSNVNFVQKTAENHFKIRTYERGVEDETLACGTGVTAAAIAANELNLLSRNEVTLETLGGMLSVRFQQNDEGNYENIWLSGPAIKVFKGEIEINENE